jgi:inhibitor of cysteine peptidase
MGRAFLAALAVAVGLLALAACGGGAPEPVELTSADDGTTVELEEGQELVIRLESNQTTGFRWNLVEAPPEETLEQVSAEYEEPEDGLVGEGGTEVWTFRAAGPGEGALKLGYFRPFEPDDVQGTFTVTVEVG